MEFDLSVPDHCLLIYPSVTAVSRCGPTGILISILYLVEAALVLLSEEYLVVAIFVSYSHGESCGTLIA